MQKVESKEVWGWEESPPSIRKGIEEEDELKGKHGT